MTASVSAGTVSTAPARAFWRFWTAETASGIGSAVTGVALPLTAVTVLDATPWQMGLVAAASFAAWLVIGLPAGVIAQRLPLRGSLVAMDAISGVAVLTVPVAWWWGHLTIAHLVLTALVLSFANVLTDVSAATFLPSIVSPAELQTRNSLMSGSYSATQLGGPSLGGLLVQSFGAAPTLVVDAFSFLVSALLLRTLPARRVDAPAAWPPIREMIREGWHFVIRHPVLRPFLWSTATINLVCGAQLALFPLYLVREQHAPAGLVGLLIAAEGAGAVAGAAITPWLTRSIGTARACIVTRIVATVGAIIIPLGAGWTSFTLFAVGNFAFAAGVAVSSICIQTYRQTASPPELLSRVTATVRFVSFGTVPIGALAGGAVAGLVGSRVVLLGLSVVTALAALMLLTSRIRRLRDLTDLALPQADR